VVAGLPLPCPIDSGEAFSEWFAPRFGTAGPVSRALELNPKFIPERLNGYVVRDGAREARSPGSTLLRALDWVWRVGPYSPYGQRLPSAAFPGQHTETNR
jgi:hypothetical protein